MTPQIIASRPSREIISYKLNAPAQLLGSEWQIVRFSEEGNEGSSLHHLPTGKLILPFAWWVSNGSDSEVMKRALRGDIGVWFSADDDIVAHAEVIHAGKKFWSLMAVDFPIFRDGRGFSTATLLRERLAWAGEIRAIGDVLVDQLLQMARVGFDAFELREDQDLNLGLKQFSLYSVTLQNSWRVKRSIATIPIPTGVSL
jgi:uncharacterized protein (DUF934 family)